MMRSVTTCSSAPTNKHRIRNLLCSASLLAVMNFTAPAAISAEDASYIVNLPAQSMTDSLKSFAKEAGVQIIYPHDKLEGLIANELVGSVSLEAGLRQLLQGTNLVYQIAKNNVVVITLREQQSPVVKTVANASLSIQTDRKARSKTARKTSRNSQEFVETEADTDDDFSFEEIIVTATKRSRRLQDVPLAISAIGERQLERLGADGFEGYYRTVPGLNFNQRDTNQGSFSIRGINTTVNTGDNQAPVAIYVDELPTDDSRGGRTSQDLNLFDVERVEVLRGPQGTLFGSGALGGAIRIITNKPNNTEFSAKIDGDLSFIDGGDPVYSLKGMVNIPLVQDKLALRAVGFYKDTGGYVDNVSTGVDNVNAAEAWGGRVAIKLDINEKLSLTATLSHQDTELEESASLNTIVANERVRANPLPEFTNTEITIYNMKVDYDFDAFSLMSSTTYSEKSTFGRQGIVGAFPIVPGVIELDVLASGPDESNSFAQELRLTSRDDQALRWVLGAFYFKRNRDATSFIEVPGIGGFLGADNDTLLDALIEFSDKEKALYGEVSYDITDKLEATVGLRWFDNKATYIDRQTGLNTGGMVIINDPDDHSENSLTPKFVLSYKATDDAMIFASVAKGYRIGGTNVPIPVVPSPPNSFGPDSLWNYELGVKTSWYDNRLIFNASVYYIDWTDIQVELTEPRTSFAYLTNGGQASSKGVEVEIIGRPISGLQLSSSFSYNDAQMNEDVLNPDDGTPFALDGDEMPGARDFTIANSVEYTRPISETFDFFVRADHQYVGNAFTSFLNVPSVGLAGVLESYSLFNLRTGFTSDRWDITLYADNLFNNDKLASQSASGNFAFRLKPRTIGINLRTQF